MIIVLLRRFSSCAAAGGTTWKKKGVCEDTSRSGRGSAPAPREILTGWGEDTSRCQGLALALREKRELEEDKQEEEYGLGYFCNGAVDVTRQSTQEAGDPG